MRFIITIYAILPLIAAASSILSRDQNASLPHLQNREAVGTPPSQIGYCEDISGMCSNSAESKINQATAKVTPSELYITNGMFVSAFHLPTNACYDADPRAGATKLASAYAHMVSLFNPNSQALNVQSLGWI